jgi:hypothetical protein
MTKIYVLVILHRAIKEINWAQEQYEIHDPTEHMIDMESIKT